MNGTHPSCSCVLEDPLQVWRDGPDSEGPAAAGRTLQEELDAGHIFILDYAIVEGITPRKALCRWPRPAPRLRGSP